MIKPYQWTEGELEKLRTMYAEGYSYRDIADALNMSYYAIRNRIREELTQGNLTERQHGGSLARYWSEKRQQRQEQERNHQPQRKTEKSKERCIERFVVRGSSLCWLCRRALPNTELPGFCRKPVEGFDAYIKERFDPVTGELSGYSYIVRSCTEFEEEPWVQRYVDKYGSLIDV